MSGLMNVSPHRHTGILNNRQASQVECPVNSDPGHWLDSVLPISKRIDSIDDRLIGVENAVKALQEKPGLPRLIEGPTTTSTTASTTLTTQDYSKQAHARLRTIGIQGLMPEDYTYVAPVQLMESIGNNVKELSDEIAGLRNINNPPGYNDACRRIMEMIAEFVETGRLPRAQPTQTQPGRPGVS